MLAGDMESGRLHGHRGRRTSDLELHMLEEGESAADYYLAFPPGKTAARGGKGELGSALQPERWQAQQRPGAADAGGGSVSSDHHSAFPAGSRRGSKRCVAASLLAGTAATWSCTCVEKGS